MRILIATVSVVLTANAALAQSVNIDIGNKNNESPSSTYAGAGLPGYWNKLDGLSWDVPFQMVGLDGSRAGAMVAVTQNGGPSAYDLQGTSGDDERLLDDFIIGWLPDFATELHFTDIQPGLYRIIVYAYRDQEGLPEDWRCGTYINYPWVFQDLSGAWTGGLEAGVTHADYQLDVLKDNLTIGVVSAVGFQYPSIFYWFNGVQLELLERYTPATLTGFSIDTGDLLVGELEDLLEPLNDSVVTRSGFGQTLIDLHLMQMTVTAHSDAEVQESMDIIIKSGISADSGLARISLQNWNTDELDQVGSYSINTQEVPVKIENIPAADYINSRGTIKTVIKHSVFVPFFAFTFESYIDHVAITVQ